MTETLTGRGGITRSGAAGTIVALTGDWVAREATGAEPDAVHRILEDAANRGLGFDTLHLEIEPGMVSWTKGTLGAGKADVERAVAAGLRAQLSRQSLVTGQLSINLDFHPDTAAKLIGTNENVPEIPSMPSDLQHIKDQIADLKLPELAEQARVALAGINRLVGELGGKLGPMADSLRETSDTA